MTVETTPYREALLQNLTDPKEAKLYLNAVLEDYPEGFLKALSNVAQARYLARLANDGEGRRETLHSALPETGNPSFETLTSVLEALDLKLSIGVRTRRRNSARRRTSSAPAERHA